MLELHLLPKKDARAFLEGACKIAHVEVVHWRGFGGRGQQLAGG